MALPLLGAAVSGVLGMIGAKKAAKEQAKSIAEQNAYNDPSAIRARAEAAGFNPLLFVGPGVGNQTSIAAPVMGQAIANAGLAIAGGISDYSKERAAQSALAQENAELRKVIDQSILRPEVPGIYGTAQPLTLPSVPAEAAAFGGSVKAISGMAGRFLQGILLPGRPINPDEKTPLFSEYGSENGQSTRLPEGPDLDELVTGMAVEGLNRMKGSAERSYRDHMLNIPAPAPWFDLNLSGGSRPPKERRYNLAHWPFYGFNPFGSAYQGTP